MKTLGTIISKAAAFLAVFTILCGVIYPLAVTGAAQALFSSQAEGSIIEIDGHKYGSKLLAQQFTEDQYLWGRPMNVNIDTFVGDNGEPLFYAGPSNKTPAGEELAAVIAERTAALQAAHPQNGREPVPIDLVTCSGSGLDPHISVAAADYQIDRIAKARGLDPSQVRQIVLKYTNTKGLGILGEETVNVLAVNLALDGLLN